MESFHPTPIVPSNAPLWAEVDQDSRVLKEQCGNRQLGYLQTQNGQDYYANINDDSTCGSAGAKASAYLQLQLGQARPGKCHYPWLSGIAADNYDSNAQHLFNNIDRGEIRGLGRIPRSHHEKDQEAENKARILARSFARCPGYIKYRNRQPTVKKGSKDEKWPDHIEDAFIVALCRHPPCGRKKAKAPGEEYDDEAKALGRNELIAHYIFRNTGYERTRKQVSSHIQVLKPFVAKEAIIMRFLALPAEKKDSAALKAARKRASEYNPDSSQLRTSSLSQHRNFPLQTTFDLQPEEFCMFVRPPETSETLHTYSSTDGFSPTNCFIQTQAELYDCFPGLDSVPLERFASGKFLALHVPIVLHPKDLVGNIELAIRWVFKAPARNPPVSISSRTRLYLCGKPVYCDKAGNRQFYDNDQPEPDQKMQEDWNNFTKETDAAEVSEQSAGMVQYYVPFSSTFWARYLWHVASLHRQSLDLSTKPLSPDETLEDRNEALHQKRLEVSSALGELTGVQEIIARTDMEEPQVVLTVHFSFSHALTMETAVTSWQYLDMTSVFDEAAGGVSQLSQSTSDSQESGLGVQNSYGGGSHDYSSFEFANGNTQHGYPDPTDSGATGLASPIELQDTQASAGYNTSWLLPTSTSDLSHLATDTLLAQQTPQILQDVNAFDFSNGNISISLDSSALSPHNLAQPQSSFDTLDLDLGTTDPLLLQPSRTTTPWLQSSQHTPTDFAVLFSHPHSPATSQFPDYATHVSVAELGDHLATVASTNLADSFDVSNLQTPFSMSQYQAFAGAGNTTSDIDPTSRNHSFSILDQDTQPGSIPLPPTSFSPNHHQQNHLHQSYGFDLKQTYHPQDSFVDSQHQDSFTHSQHQESFIHPQHQDYQGFENIEEHQERYIPREEEEEEEFEK